MKISQRLKFDLPEVKTIVLTPLARHGMGGRKKADLIHFILLTDFYIFLGNCISLPKIMYICGK